MSNLIEMVFDAWNITSELTGSRKFGGAWFSSDYDYLVKDDSNWQTFISKFGDKFPVNKPEKGYLNPYIVEVRNADNNHLIIVPEDKWELFQKVQEVIYNQRDLFTTFPKDHRRAVYQFMLHVYASESLVTELSSETNTREIDERYYHLDYLDWGN